MATSQKKVSIDLTPFQEILTTNAADHQFETCSAVQRLLIALKYYTSLLHTENINAFFDFMEKTYKSQIHDDYYHLTKFHQDQLHNILDFSHQKYELTNDCDLSKCNFSNRHYRNSTTSTTHGNAPNMYIETMDSLHFYLYHLIESGLRQNQRIETTEYKVNDEYYSDPYFDRDFTQMSNSMRDSRDATNRFSRLNGNKFNISIAIVDDQHSNNININHEIYEHNDTFLDHLYCHLEQQMEQHKIYEYINKNEEDNINDPLDDEDKEFADENDALFDQDDFDGNDDWGSDNNEFETKQSEERTFTYEYNHQHIQQLKQFFIEYEYDTESIDIDLYMFIHSGSSNTSSNIPNKVMMNELIHVLKESKSDSGLFAIGIPWEYWGPVTNDEYYVYPKYSNFKEEILNYTQLQCGEYTDCILPKAQQLLQTNICKSRRAGMYPGQLGLLNEYGNINRHDCMQLDHLICIILYTDYSELSSDFTKSFRKLNPYELLQQVRKRNERYYHWSKLLKETVKCFGGNDYCIDDPIRGEFFRLIGPLYTGMSGILNVSQFNIFLLSPTSTSIQIHVAIKFSGDKGMILEFDNTQSKGRAVAAMDCSWISRFPEEDERLFFGDAEYPINISSIRTIDGNRNYGKIIKAMTLFDNIISGNIGGMSFYEPSSKLLQTSRPILKHLLYGDYKQDGKNKLNPFIYSCWKTFIENKEEIKINMLLLNEVIKDKVFMDVLMVDGFETYNYEDANKTNYTIPEEDSGTNLLLFDVFRNVKSIEFESNMDSQCKLYWSFSLLKLLSLVEKTNVMKIEIRANAGDENKTWLSQYRSSALWSSIREQYKSKNFSIKYLCGQEIIIKRA